MRPDLMIIRPEKRERYPLLALAALLIVNSHLEAFYPHPLLAADGLLGICIFFLLSGYGIAVSLSSRPRGFGVYAAERVLRLYPSVILAYLAFEAWKGPGRAQSPWDYALSWTFLNQIVVYYAAVYAYVLWLRTRVPLAALQACLCLAYAAVYVATYGLAAPAAGVSLGKMNIALFWIFYFQVTLAGVGLASPGARAPKRPYALAAVCAVAYFAVRAALAGGWIPNFLFAAKIAVVPLIVALFHALGGEATARALERARVAPAAKALGSMTLEIFLVHVNFLFLSPLPFPVNVLLVFAASIAASWPIESAARFVRERAAAASGGRWGMR